MGLFDQPAKKPRRRGFGVPAASRGYFAEYAYAYWVAATALSEREGVEDGYPPNYGVFPVAFLYRHALELAIKSILAEHGSEIDRRPEDILKSSKGNKIGHSVGHFIEGSEEAPREAYPAEFRQCETPEFTFDDLVGLLNEWDKFDPDAIIFRYGVKKNLQPTLPREGFVLNLPVFANRWTAQSSTF